MAPGAVFFWAGFCRRKIVPGGRSVPAPGTSQEGGSGRVGRPGGPCGQGEARLAVHKSTGEGVILINANILKYTQINTNKVWTNYSHLL